ncbi:MAG TPA: hypothetical protein VKB92_17310 [Myxococcales bacterium]|nr:hypothetical protein [Myxococcales bacterium]
MRRFALAASMVLFCCAGEPRPDAKPAKLVPAQLVGCAVAPPAAKSGAASLPDMSADFQVDARGRVRDVHIQGAGGSAARALRRHLESCEYAPATRDGHPIASRRAAVYGGYQ